MRRASELYAVDTINYIIDLIKTSYHKEAINHNNDRPLEEINFVYRPSYKEIIIYNDCMLAATDSNCIDIVYIMLDIGAYNYN